VEGASSGLDKTQRQGGKGGKRKPELHLGGGKGGQGGGTFDNQQRKKKDSTRTQRKRDHCGKAKSSIMLRMTGGSLGSVSLPQVTPLEKRWKIGDKDTYQNCLFGGLTETLKEARSE